MMRYSLPRPFDVCKPLNKTSETAMDTKNVSPLLTAKIVRSYVRHNTVAASQLPDLIATVHRSLGEVGRLPIVEKQLPPAVSIRQSVRRDYVVCLECGYRAQMLRRHINSRHGLSPAEYLKRWGLSPDHPLTAPAYSEHRSVLAKELGLGRKPKSEAAESAAVFPDEKVEASPKPRRTSRSRSKSDVVKEAPSEPTKARQRRSRSRVATTQS